LVLIQERVAGASVSDLDTPHSLQKKKKNVANDGAPFVRHAAA